MAQVTAAKLGWVIAAALVVATSMAFRKAENAFDAAAKAKTDAEVCGIQGDGLLKRVNELEEKIDDLERKLASDVNDLETGKADADDLESLDSRVSNLEP